MADRRLIEAGFPCHQVGAETQRERGASSALPPLYFLHVWWARRPLTPSRAAIAASLLPDNTDASQFVRTLGIEKKVIELSAGQWTIIGKLAERIEKQGGIETLKVDAVVARAFDKEQLRRAKNRETIATLKAYSTELANHSVVIRWEQESQSLGQIHEGELLTIKRVMGDPAHTNERIELKRRKDVRKALGKELNWDPEDLYGYGRAYQNGHSQVPSGLTVLDPTSGGGSIPFEALRLGHNVIANELNPVATTILYATLDYPARFGKDLYHKIEKYGHLIISRVHSKIEIFHPSSSLCQLEKHKPGNHLGDHIDLTAQFNKEEIADYLYCRQVTCPSCKAKTPLLNTCWLSKQAKDQWGVRIVTSGNGPSARYHFETYQATSGKGPGGENPEHSTVKRGIGQCVHCQQAIPGDEIKAQARGESQYGQWQDELYAVVAIRHQPKLDKEGHPQYFSTGPRRGEIKTEKIRFFRPPNQTDRDALAAASARLQADWARFDEQGLIPTENIPFGTKTSEPLRYGMNRYCEMFNDRQLLGHLTAMETLKQLKPQILSELGKARGRAVITYLQFAIDKTLDYNSRQTRWEFTRGVVKGTFGRHDFSLKWTYGEMVFSGPHSGLKWGLSQILDGYKGIQQLVEPAFPGGRSDPPVDILNGSAVHIPSIESQSIDLVCMDPPYYNNVQYAELSDYFYVWQKRSLKDLYPEIAWTRLTNKREEAVANPARDGSTRKAKEEYEELMGEIFAESRRVVKDDGLMTLMFTHKAQDAWETLTRSLIEAGWEITSCFPVESESGHSTHQMNMASAASTIFISCRKRDTKNQEPAFWSGLGDGGVQHQVRTAVEQGLAEFRPLKLNAVDQMIACYGRALQVLSKHWPVMDGDDEVSPIHAMNEASRVVAGHQISEITDGRISVDDLDSETAIALTLYGIWGHNEVAFSEVLNLSRSLNTSLETRTGGYHIDGRMVGVNTEIRGRRSVAGQAAEEKGYAAPLVKKGSTLRLAKPEERSIKRLSNPQSDWDVLHGLLIKYREGDIPVARAYLEEQREGNENTVLDLLTVWGEEAETPEARNEARALLFGLRQ